MRLDRGHAVKTGLILETGEVWDGVERRACRLLCGAVTTPSPEPEPVTQSSEMTSNFFG
jgi:hypothetical protein